MAVMSTVGTIEIWSKFISYFNFSWLSDYSNQHIWANFWLLPVPQVGKPSWPGILSCRSWSRTLWISLDTEVMAIFIATQCIFNVYLARSTRPSALFDLWYLESSNLHVIVIVWLSYMVLLNRTTTTLIQKGWKAKFRRLENTLY